MADLHNSLFINHIDSKFSKDVVYEIINSKNWGIISNIDLIHKTNYKGDKYNIAFIHFEKWFSNDKALSDKHYLFNNPNNFIELFVNDKNTWIIKSYKKSNSYYLENKIQILQNKVNELQNTINTYNDKFNDIFNKLHYLKNTQDLIKVGVKRPRKVSFIQ